MSAFSAPCQLFHVSGGSAEETSSKIYLGLFQHYNGPPISLQELRRGFADAFHLQTAAVCQRYDYIERHGHIRDFNLNSPGVATRMAAPGSIYLRYNTEREREGDEDGTVKEDFEQR